VNGEADAMNLKVDSKDEVMHIEMSDLCQTQTGGTDSALDKRYFVMLTITLVEGSLGTE